MRRAVAAVVVAAAVVVVPPAAGVSPASGKPTILAAPCRHDDGSGQRVCVWDGRHQGNGRGSSYLVTHDTRGRAHFHPMTHAEAHRVLMSWRGSRCGR